MNELVTKVGEYSPDNLIAKLEPSAQTFGIKIAALQAETLIKRGTLLTRAASGKYSVYTGASSEKPNAILADDVLAGTSDTTAVAYRSGNFNPEAVILPDSYTLTAADEDELRKYDIIFTQMI